MLISQWDRETLIERLTLEYRLKTTNYNQITHKWFEKHANPRLGCLIAHYFATHMFQLNTLADSHLVDFLISEFFEHCTLMLKQTQSIIEDKKTSSEFESNLNWFKNHNFFHQYNAGTFRVRNQLLTAIKYLGMSVDRYLKKSSSKTLMRDVESVIYITRCFWEDRFSKKTSYLMVNQRMALFEPMIFPNRWLTSDTTALATTIYEENKWDMMPILADALMDAGCEDDYLLWVLKEHHHICGRGMWVIDHLSGKGRTQEW